MRKWHQGKGRRGSKCSLPRGRGLLPSLLLNQQRDRSWAGPGYDGGRLKTAFLLTEAECYSAINISGRLSSVTQHGREQTGRQKVRSSSRPSAGLLPSEGDGLAGPIHRRKPPGIRTPTLDPKAPHLLPASKRFGWEPDGLPRGQVGRRQGMLAPQSEAGGAQGTLLGEGAAGWRWARPGIGLPASQGRAPVARPARGRRVGAQDDTFCRTLGWSGSCSRFFLAILSVRVRFFSLKVEKALDGSSLSSASLAFCPLYSSATK